jgi:predicted transcriptional regulator
MKNTIINLGEGDNKKFYYAYVSIIISPIYKLRKREEEILALFLYYNNEKMYIEEEDRLKIVFSINTRKKICEELKISNSIIQQILNSLRKKNLVKGIKFNESILVKPEVGKNIIGFSLYVKNE